MVLLIITLLKWKFIVTTMVFFQCEIQKLKFSKILTYTHIHAGIVSNGRINSHKIELKIELKDELY